jgi:MoxR-like ATPase
MDQLPFEHRIDIQRINDAALRIKQEIGKVVVGQDKAVELLLTAILANGHILLEGVPGVAKTLTAKLMARTINVGFSRIQFTPDLMPSDVMGYQCI